MIAYAQGQSDICPIILSPEKGYRYIKHLRTLPFIVKKEFGWMYFEKDYVPGAFSDSSSIEMYQFPNQITMISIADIGASGMVIYRTDTDSILAIENWGNKIMEYFPKDFNERFGFSAYYSFHKEKNRWKMNVFLFASLESGYRTMYMDYDLVALRCGGGSMDVVTRKYHK